MSNAKKLIILIIVPFILLISFSVFLSLLPKSYLIFKVAPDDLSLYLNNKLIKKISSDDKVKIKPGEYTLKLTRRDFSEYKVEINIKNNETKEILAGLSPLNDAAIKIISDNKYNEVLQKQNNIKMDSEIKDITKNYPIIKILPIEARLYKVYICQSVKNPDDNSKLAVCIDGTQEELRPYVIKDITSKGYNLDDYEVVWNLNNPTEY